MASASHGGIYRIVHVGSGKEYIGSARNIELRWRIHRNQLNRGKHHSVHLQRAYNRDGVEMFRYEVLELVTDPNNLILREQHYIDTRKPEYNVSPIAGSQLGLRFTAESKGKQKGRQ